MLGAEGLGFFPNAVVNTGPGTLMKKVQDQPGNNLNAD